MTKGPGLRGVWQGGGMEAFCSAGWLQKRTPESVGVTIYRRCPERWTWCVRRGRAEVARRGLSGGESRRPRGAAPFFVSMSVSSSSNGNDGGAASTTTKLVELKNVSYSFGSTQIIRDLNFELHEGEIVCLLGPSGCGKSTILRIMSGLAQPTSGQVLYRGHEFEGVNPGTAIVFQTFALFPWLTVLENVELGIPSGPERRKRAMTAIDTIGLDGFVNAYPRELSGGMRQRVGFARALAVEPEVLCMDEPFSALDVLTAENLRSELLRLWTGGEIPTKAIFVVTHGIEEAVGIADRIVVLQRAPGRIRASLPVTIPHPRDTRSPEFQQLVDQVYTIISRPDQDASEILAAKEQEVVSTTVKETPLVVIDTSITQSVEVAEADSGFTKRRPMLPAVRIGSVAGLLNFIDEKGVDLYRLAQTLQLDIDEIYPIIEAAHILSLLDVEEGDVMINERGSLFMHSSINERKQLVRESILNSEGSWLVRQIYHLLRQSRRTNRIPQELIFDTMLLKHFTPQEARRQMEIAVEWGRYAELFGYDAPAAELFLEKNADEEGGGKESGSIGLEDETSATASTTSTSHLIPTSMSSTD